MATAGKTDHRSHGGPKAAWPAGSRTVPPFGVEVLPGVGVLQFQDDHLVELQKEGVQAAVVQEGAQQLSVFWAELNSVLGFDLPKGLLQCGRKQ